MSEKILVLDSYITIKYDNVGDWLYADWHGDQTEQSVMDGCEMMLHYLKQERCCKVLNDNTNVTSIWLDASKWVGEDWFPRMNDAGLKYFAWVYSPNVYSRLSTDESLKYGGKSVAITFESIETARQWLKSV
ncbi:MAG: hypothetical protein LPJ89_10690 [Hymenobacteraceae bacterium]|nr:hypothetical protein [Hymenobacteraceae bacterium]MDX5395172.1 hypothetical protein [Hymenobacteraceae bacterium]MDX5444234.1 hypothetical protein [Hymenobacteraceae bacterium]MDX5511209.1 hypothetical protein [Hymenobacteraceae bacterium]